MQKNPFKVKEKLFYVLITLIALTLSPLVVLTAKAVSLQHSASHRTPQTQDPTKSSRTGFITRNDTNPNDVHQGDTLLIGTWGCNNDCNGDTITFTISISNAPAGMQAYCTPSVTTGNEVTNCRVYTTLKTPLGTYLVNQTCTGSDPNIPLYCSGAYSITVVPAQYVVDVVLAVTPTTPMWNIDLDVLLDQATIVCPATVSLNVGPLAAITGDVCNGQSTSQSDVHVLLPVFNNANPSDTLTPNSIVSVQASEFDATGHHSFSTSVQMPPAPIWIGVGDSFSSGHHQDSNGLIYTRDDASYSWVTKAATYLNNNYNVPSLWQMTVDLEAHSGATTTQMAQSQMSAMYNSLTAHAGSWNVVSIDGGANDMDFADPLASYYLKSTFTQSGVLPWNVQAAGKNAQNCLNTQSMWLSLDKKQGAIIKNLQAIISFAVFTDPNVRIVTLTYPYVMNTTNPCSLDIKNGLAVTWHGSKSVVDRLDMLYSTLKASNGKIISVDLRTSSDFGSSPLGDLQLVYYFGYPHPNAVGQSAIAALAARSLKAIRP